MVKLASIYEGCKIFPHRWGNMHVTPNGAGLTRGNFSAGVLVGHDDGLDELGRGD